MWDGRPLPPGAITKTNIEDGKALLDFIFREDGDEERLAEEDVLDEEAQLELLR